MNMPMIKKSITVTDQQESWIQAQLATGNYATDSEIVREALREKQMRMHEAEQIRIALTEAEHNDLTSRNKEEIRQEFIDEMKRDGTL